MHRSNGYTNILKKMLFSSPLPLILIAFFPRASTSPLNNHSNTPKANNYECHPLDLLNTVCSRWYQTAQVPNIFGHDTLLKAQIEMNNVLMKMSGYPSEETLSFMCVIYLPPCYGQIAGVDPRYTSLPCQSMCDTASQSVKYLRNNNNNNDNNIISNNSDGINISNKPGNGNMEQVNFRPWPVMCHTLPTQRCYVFERNTGVSYIKTSPLDFVKGHRLHNNEIPKVASIEAELGDVTGEGYDLEVVSLSTNQDRGRRYDITDLGDPDLFQGWADVQGTGSANDYCRVVGRYKRRFLSCHLSGNANQGHHYVSKLGFEMGHPGTWFMRDMDGDGRDDYCRCVGPSSNSKVTCMKAGPKGFHGSPMEAGSQHSFTLTSSSGCHNRQVNALFGE